MYCINCSGFSFLGNPNLQPRNIQSISFAHAAFILQAVCSHTCDLILSNSIGRDMRYGESKKLVFRGVQFKDVVEKNAFNFKHSVE